jgi:hypothetical protein
MIARSVATALATALAALGPAAVHAQAKPVVQPAAATEQPTLVNAVVEDAHERQQIYSVRADLRELVAAQEMFWRSRKTYATDLSALSAFHPSPGVNVQIVRARTTGWAARATYGESIGPSRSCVIWVGDVPAAERPVTDVERKSYPEAEATCDGDGYSSRNEWMAAGQSYMKYALEGLARSETRFFAFHRRYTTNAATLDPFIWDSDVSVTITKATPKGWVARATFTGSPGKTCTVWHGTLDALDLPHPTGQPAPAEGEVSCNG